MKITAFDPHVITKDAEPVIELFEALGFERRHKKDVDDFDTSDIRMKDSNGFHVDITQTDLITGGDRTAIRMNVDDFDAAYQLLADRGFKNLYGKQPLSTKTSRSAMMALPSGLTINLVHHIKKDR